MQKSHSGAALGGRSVSGTLPRSLHGRRCEPIYQSGNERKDTVGVDTFGHKVRVQSTPGRQRSPPPEIDKLFLAKTRVPARGLVVSVSGGPKPTSTRRNCYFADSFGRSGRVTRAASLLGLHGRLIDDSVHPKLNVTSMCFNGHFGVRRLKVSFEWQCSLRTTRNT